MEFFKMIVGEQVCPPRPEGVVFDLSNSGAILLIAFNRPHSEEIEQVKKGTANFKIAKAEGIMFFLSKFGSMNWMDSPYNLFLSDVDLQKIVPDSQLQGLLLHVMMIDASTGVLKAQRAIGLQHDFTMSLLDMAANSSLDSAETYNQTLNRVYGQFSTDSLVQLSTISNR